MKTPEKTTTSKTFEIEYTSADLSEMRENGYSEDELPSKGSHTFRRARHIVPRKEQKIRISIFLDGDIIDYFKKIGEETETGYQTLINQTLRAQIVDAEIPESAPLTEDKLFEKDFLSKLKAELATV